MGSRIKRQDKIKKKRQEKVEGLYNDRGRKRKKG